MKQYKVSKSQQVKELTRRVPPVVNVDIVVTKDWNYLVGKRAKGAPDPDSGYWLFPGSRMKFEETPQETAMRVLKNELPGIRARLKKLITVLSDKGFDKRAYGVTIYYLFDYLSGNPKPNKQLEEFKWVNFEEFKSLRNAYSLEIGIFQEIDLAVRTMNTTEDEILVEVNKDNKEIGTIIKRDAHSNPQRYHRAAHIILFNSKGQVILQQRGFQKTHHPGRWDMPGGHQTAGNTIEETASQELMEEMGIKSDLDLKRIGLFQNDKQSEFYYLYWSIHDGPYKFDKHEVEKVKAFECKKLLEGEYDKDFSILPHVYEYVRELIGVWEPLLKK